MKHTEDSKAGVGGATITEFCEPLEVCRKVNEKGSPNLHLYWPKQRNQKRKIVFSAEEPG